MGKRRGGEGGRVGKLKGRPCALNLLRRLQAWLDREAAVVTPSPRSHLGLHLTCFLVLPHQHGPLKLQLIYLPGLILRWVHTSHLELGQLLTEEWPELSGWKKTSHFWQLTWG